MVLSWDKTPWLASFCYTLHHWHHSILQSGVKTHKTHWIHKHQCRPDTSPWWVRWETQWLAPYCSRLAPYCFEADTLLLPARILLPACILLLSSHRRLASYCYYKNIPTPPSVPSHNSEDPSTITTVVTHTTLRTRCLLLMFTLVVWWEIQLKGHELEGWWQCKELQLWGIFTLMLYLMVLLICFGFYFFCFCFDLGFYLPWDISWM